MAGPVKRNEDWKWYLLPGIFGILGGLVGWLILKDRDAVLAKNLIIFAVAALVAGFIIGAIFAAIGLTLFSGTMAEIMGVISGGTF